MQHRDAFSACHPAVNLLFFTLTLTFSAIVRHPVSQGISLLCALCCCGSLRRLRGLWYLLPLMAVTVLLNGAFNHRGVTILTYLPSGNPLTLESLLFGVSAAVMLATVLLWFSCLTAVMTTDKFIYLFGRVLPVLSLLLSMTLRFIPRLTQQGRQILQAQKTVGQEGHKLRRGAQTLSVLLTWSLENALETADSMKGRGYGLAGRTAYAIYHLDGRDRLLLWWLGLCGAMLLGGLLAGGFEFRYYPALWAAPLHPISVLWHTAHLALGLTPLILNLREDRLWKKSASKA